MLATQPSHEFSFILSGGAVERLSLAIMFTFKKYIYDFSEVNIKMRQGNRKREEKDAVCL